MTLLKHDNKDLKFLKQRAENKRSLNYLNKIYYTRNIFNQIYPHQLSPYYLRIIFCHKL